MGTTETFNENGKGISNTAQLRDEIDRGGAGDKVAFSDPAAAPLGTDDEAAGHPPTRKQVAHAAAQEGRRGNADGHKGDPAELQGNRTGSVLMLTLSAVVTLALIGLLLWLL